MLKSACLRRTFSNVRTNLRPITTKSARVPEQFSPATSALQSEDEIRPEYKEMLKDFDYLLNQVKDISVEYYKQCGVPQNLSITKYAMPQEIIDELGPIVNEPASNDECIRNFKTVFEYSVKNLSPYYFDKLGQSSDPIGQVSELVTAVINNNAHVFHAAPVGSVMEREAIKIIGRGFGFADDKIDGILTPGGSAANIIALLTARHHRFPHVRAQGWKAEDRPVCFAPQQAHYSTTRAAIVAGVGLDNIVQVRGCPRTGQMDPEALDKAIEDEKAKGNNPFFIMSLSGTTVLGGFDNHEAMNAVAKKHGVWHHVDACWGGFLAWADEDRKGSMFTGIEKADSVAMNPHKGWGVPQQCAALITNDHNSALQAANASGAEYLFVDSPTAQYDIGDKTLNCGRRTDGIKLFLTLKKHGLDGMRQIANNSIDCARYVTQAMKASPDRFEMVNEPMGTNVCFWYIPPYYRENPTEWTDSAKAEVHKYLYTAQQKNGSILICQTPLEIEGIPNFLRLVLKSSKINYDDMDFILTEVDRLGKHITPEVLATEEY